MQILTQITTTTNLSLALGFFDGVHIGHQSVIQSAVNFAKEHGNKSAIITFSEHPYCSLLDIKPEYILTKQQREERIAELGVDYLYELDFKNVATLNAEEYLKNILIKNFSPLSISTGWNHNFGCKKSGDAKFLHEHSKEFGYKYFELPPQKVNGEIISSTAIRKYLSNGNIETANKMLGHKFEISGKVKSGNQLGRTIDFPTANLVYPEELVKLPHGVYAVETNYGKGIANYGNRPTINGTEALLEVHILNFHKDIYEKYLTVQFNKMLRSEQKFPSLEALKKQIQLDIQSII